MHDGWEYVAAVYALTALLLGVWFWMVLRKLRAHPRRCTSATPRAERTL